MKKSILLFIVFFLAFVVKAQKDVGETASEYMISENDSTKKTWELEGNIGLFANQAAFVNWSGGGVSSFSFSLSASAEANYYKNKHSWDSDFSASYGILFNQGEKPLKNNDVFELNSNYGYQVDKNGKVFIGALLKFSNQFSQGFNPGDSLYTTNFMAPAKLVLAAGLIGKPTDYFSLFFSPAAGKFTFVLDENVDEVAFGLENDKTIKSEFGAYLKMSFKKEFFKNLNVKSTLTLFNNFLDNSIDTLNNNGYIKYVSNRPNIDIDWLVGIDLVFSKWLTVNIGTQLVYDHDIKIALTEKDGLTPLLDINGIQKTGPRVQFSEALSIGLTYRFKPKEEKVKPAPEK